MGHEANIEIMAPESSPSSLWIRDLGPWEEHFSITNDAERVVRTLVAQGLLPEGRRLFYIDSMGEPTEIRIRDGKWCGFDNAPEPPGVKLDG